MRLKGLGILLSVQNVAQAFVSFTNIHTLFGSNEMTQNQWVNPVALDAIGWKYYIVYLVLQCVYLVLIVLFFPETRCVTLPFFVHGRSIDFDLYRRLTIEEVSVIFDKGRLGGGQAAVAEFQENQKDIDARGDSLSPEKENVTTVESKNVAER